MKIFSPLLAGAFLVGGVSDLSADERQPVTLPSTRSPVLLKLTNAPPSLPKPQFRANPEFHPGLPGKGLAGTNSFLAPGVYKTEPFTCLVLVPGRHPDDVAVLGKNLPPGPRIRQWCPDLRFVPRR